MKLEVLHDVERPEGWSYQLEVTAKSAKKGRQKSKILLDAGDFGENDINLDKAAKSNYVVITHLHKDHSQHLEKLVDHPDFNGKIIMSDEAYENLKWKLQYRERDKSLNEIQKKYKKEIEGEPDKIQ